MSAEDDHAEFPELHRSWADWLKLLEEDPEELRKATVLWFKVCQQILEVGYRTCHESVHTPDTITGDYRLLSNITFNGLLELLKAFALWCDRSRYSIDPTPLFETVRLAAIVFATCELETNTSSETATEYFNSYIRSQFTLTRMVYVAFCEAGRKPPEMKTTMIAVTPRFKPPKCPECGEESYVTSTRESIRHIKCKNQSCGHQWQLTKST